MKTAPPALRVRARALAIISSVLAVLTGCSGPTTSGGSGAPNAKVDACGSPAAPRRPAPLWVSRYDGPSQFKDFATAEVVSPNGRVVFVTGRSSGANLMADYATVAYNAATGAQLWASRYNGPANGPDFPLAIAISPDGRTVFVTGISGQPPYGAQGDYATVAYDAATGSQLWVSRFGAGGGGEHMAVSPDGHTVILIGQYPGSYWRDDSVTIAYDAATGARLWARRYATGGADSAAALAFSADSRAVFVAGNAYFRKAPGVTTTVAYDTATGAQLWARRYPIGNGGPGLSSVRVSPDGRTVLEVGEFRRNSAITTIAYDKATGARRWVRTLAGRQQWIGSHPNYSLAFSPDQQTMFIAGHRATGAYAAATGRQLWLRGYASARELFRGQAVATSRDGRTVYVMGACVSRLEHVGFGVVAFRAATGARLWASTYAAGVVSVTVPFTGIGEQVAVSPDGLRVFMIAHSSRAKHDADFLIVAYRA